jgi:sugar/nucleoside kinase (ribokinase family)
MKNRGHGINISVLGHILNEKIVFPNRTIHPVLGSPVAYSSVCMAKLGVLVGIVTKIGNDFPESMLTVFNEAGVITQGIKVGENSTKNELIYDKRGYKSVKYLTKAEDIFYEDIPESYWKANIFYICPMDHEVSLETIKSISRRIKITAVDLGGYGGGTSAVHPIVKNGKEIRDLCPYFHIVKASLEDCMHIFGEERGNEKEVGNNVIAWGGKICVITLGERGSYVKTKDKEKYIPPFSTSRKNLIDQTGAGDCYAAGYLTNYLESEDPFRSAVYATATTSYVIEKTGGVMLDRIPNKEEVQRRAKLIEENCRKRKSFRH